MPADKEPVGVIEPRASAPGQHRLGRDAERQMDRVELVGLAVLDADRGDTVVTETDRPTCNRG